MDENQKPPSVLMFPYVAHGHIYPFFELSKRLSKRNFHIYFCSTPINLHSIKAPPPPPSIELVELQLPSSPQLPPHMHTTKNLPPHLMPDLIEAFQESRTSYVQILDDKKPNLVIYDFFQPWAPKLAGARGIPAVVFGIIGATPYSYYHHYYTRAKDPHSRFTFPYEAIYVLDHEHHRDGGTLDRMLKDDGGDGHVEDDEFMYGNFARSSEVVLMKSCREVEGKYADYLSSLCKKEVVTTGPLYRDYGADQNKESAEEYDGGDGDVLKWLSGKDEGSTLYISFGSEHFLSEREIQEIAKGLEMCDDGLNFIWVIRFAPNEHGDDALSGSRLDKVLPQTFLEKMKEIRGRIITGWAPQQKILAHPSVGGFLSHCGSNAITEAMVFGVPIIAVPVKYEQPVAARLLVEAGFAVEVAGKPSESNLIYNDYMGEDIAEGINKLFVEKEYSEVLRKRAIRSWVRRSRKLKKMK